MYIFTVESLPEEYSEPDVKSKLRSRKKGLYTKYFITNVCIFTEPEEYSEPDVLRSRKKGLYTKYFITNVCIFTVESLMSEPEEYYEPDLKSKFSRKRGLLHC